MSTPMIEVPYGTVTGQYVLVTHDSEDEDLTPDVQPLNGTVTLTPTVPAGRIGGVLAQIAPITQAKTPATAMAATIATAGDSPACVARMA